MSAKSGQPVRTSRFPFVTWLASPSTMKDTARVAMSALILK